MIAAEISAKYKNKMALFEIERKREDAELRARADDEHAMAEQKFAATKSQLKLESEQRITNLKRELKYTIENARKLKEEKEENLTLPLAFVEGVANSLVRWVFIWLTFYKIVRTHRKA